MVKEVKLVETENGYEIYKGDDVYITPLLTRIIIKDKGLAEAALRKFNFNRPMAVKRYLCRFDYDKLVGLIEEHIALDKRLNRSFSINIYMEMARLLAFFSSSREKRVVFFRGSHSLLAIILKHPLFCVNNLNKLKFDIVGTTALSLHEQTTTKNI